MNKFGSGLDLDKLRSMAYRDAQILRICIEAENEASKMNQSDSEDGENTQKFVDPRGQMLLNGLEIPEELRYPDD